ncbi:tyrosine--tRNA ligase, partial [Escherichia coli]
KADGTKFGKSEGGNIWLSAEYTSPYKFYQYWLNVADADADRYIKIFTFISREDIEALVKEHSEAPHLRVLQRRLAEEVTIMVHGQEQLDNAIKASNILFGNSSTEDLKQLDEKTFLEVFDGVGQSEVAKADIEAGLTIVDALAANSNLASSNGDARRSLQANSISVNKEKVAEDYVVTTNDLINDQFVLLQKGKKNYFVLHVK